MPNTIQQIAPRGFAICGGMGGTSHTCVTGTATGTSPRRTGMARSSTATPIG